MLYRPRPGRRQHEIPDSQRLDRGCPAWREHWRARREALVHDEVWALTSELAEDPIEIATEDGVAHDDPLRTHELHRLALRRLAPVLEHRAVRVDPPQPLGPLPDQHRRHEHHVAAVAAHPGVNGGAHRLAHAHVVEPLDPVPARRLVQVLVLKRGKVVPCPFLQLVVLDSVLRVGERWVLHWAGTFSKASAWSRSTFSPAPSAAASCVPSQARNSARSISMA